MRLFFRPSGAQLLVSTMALVVHLQWVGAQTDETVSDTNPPDNKERSFVQLNPQDQVPTVRAIVPVDGANVFFLNHRGQIGVAKFSPGLSQIGWEFYSEVKLHALPFIALGPKYSVITASPNEITQSFDTDRNVELDFFQALARDWPGRAEGVTITAGPVADHFGRILFALSPAPAKPGETAKAKLIAWHPSAKDLVTVTESELRIDAFAVNRTGLLAARLHMPDYKDGYFLSLTELPPFDPALPDAIPAPLPFTMPSLVIPAELTMQAPPKQLCFLHEEGTEKILLTCPDSKHLIEIVPEKSGLIWQGAILLRAKTKMAIETLAEMSPGVILGGSDTGFVPLNESDDPYRIRRITLAQDGIALDFNRPVDRVEAGKPSNYSVKALSKAGSKELISIETVIESDGRTVVIKTDPVPAGTVLRVICKNVPSESGETLMSKEVFYTVYHRGEPSR